MAKAGSESVKMATPIEAASSRSQTSNPTLSVYRGFPDYYVWEDPATFERYRGYHLSHEVAKEKAWWWRLGFRLVNPSRPKGDDYSWCCEAYFLSGERAADCLFVAMTPKSMVSHLAKKHQIEVGWTLTSLGQGHPERWGLPTEGMFYYGV